MPIVINVGDAFLLDIPNSDNEHLFIAIAQKSGTDCFLFVNVTTLTPRSDQSCILKPSPTNPNTLNFVKRDSCINYKDARQFNAEGLELVIKVETRKPYERCPAGLLRRIQQAGLRSKRLPRKHKEVLQKYLEESKE